MKIGAKKQKKTGKNCEHGIPMENESKGMLCTAKIQIG